MDDAPARRQPDEGLYILRFFALWIVYLVAAHYLGWLMDRMGGATMIELVLRPFDSESGIVTKINLPRAILRGGFCLLFARKVGYHRRDSVWAAFPGLTALYFAVKIAWRFVNLPNNRYWAADPIDERDDFALQRRSRVS